MTQSADLNLPPIRPLTSCCASSTFINFYSCFVLESQNHKLNLWNDIIWYLKCNFNGCSKACEACKVYNFGCRSSAKYFLASMLRGIEVLNQTRYLIWRIGTVALILYKIHVLSWSMTPDSCNCYCMPSRL